MTHPCHYGILLSNKYKIIAEYIKLQTPLLNDSFYKQATRVYWFLHNITDFPVCKICGKKFEYKNVVATVGYPDFCSTRCSNLSSTTQYKMKQSYISHFGVDSPFKCKKCIDKRKQTYLKHYGTDHNMKSSKGYQEYINGVIKNNGKIVKTRLYQYDNLVFDSSWELATYIWLKDTKVNFIYHPNIDIKYVGSDEQIHAYLPDFLLVDNNQLLEIKGDNNFTKDGKPIRENKIPWFEKFYCMKQHNVKIWMKKEIQPILNYISNKYGKNYLKQFRKV